MTQLLIAVKLKHLNWGENDEFNLLEGNCLVYDGPRPVLVSVEQPYGIRLVERKRISCGICIRSARWVYVPVRLEYVRWSKRSIVDA